MFKKTLLTFAIICLVFGQTFACKKKMKGAWKKIKPKPKPKPPPPWPHPATYVHMEDINYPFRSRLPQGKKTPSIKLLVKLIKSYTRVTLKQVVNSCLIALEELCLVQISKHLSFRHVQENSFDLSNNLFGI